MRHRGLYVSSRLFARQLAAMAAAGFRSVPLGRPALVDGKPSHEFVITFDDGYESVFRYGLPILRSGGMRSIQFLVSDRIGGWNDWDIAEGERPSRLMDMVQVREWLAAGQEIGSHTLSHPRLSLLPRGRQREEIAGSKRRLEDMFGLEIAHFCYPYGDLDDAVVELVAEAGYATACTHLEGGVNTAATPRLRLLRLEARHRIRNFRSVLNWFREMLPERRRSARPPAQA